MELLVREFGTGRCLMGRLSPGDDLLGTLEALVRERSITSGQVQFIGALQKGALGYYDQTVRQYRVITLDRHLEIAAGMGNVSLRDGQPMVHAHLVLSDEEGHCWGGHLVPGNVVFACEFALLVLEGEPWSRYPDDYTGLALWRQPGAATAACRPAAGCGARRGN
ncbi:MAG: DUF296 domain-containing protein [Bacillota bacterium]